MKGKILTAVISAVLLISILCIFIVTALSGSKNDGDLHMDASFYEPFESEWDEANSAVVATSNQNNDGSVGSQTVSDVPNSGISDDAEWWSSNIGTDSAHITSEQVRSLAPGLTYKKIVEMLGITSNFGYNGVQNYIVDEDKILVLKFASVNDVCHLSGEELLATAVAYKFSGGEVPNGAVYGIALSNNFIICPGGLSDCYYLSITDKTEIMFDNGQKATKEDIKEMNGVLAYFDVVAESYPPQANCLKIVIY